MTRWADGIYDSDAALDYFSTITDWLERELAYWLSPENVQHHSRWVAEVMSVIELILLFERYHKGSEDYVCDRRAVQRWRTIFFDIWDDEWDVVAKNDFPHNRQAFREKERATIALLFDYLENKALYLEDDDLADQTRLPKVPLPRYSKYKWYTDFGQATIKTGQVIQDLIKYLEQTIIYYHSPEKWALVISTGMEEAWVAVDLLGFITETYELSPGVYSQTVEAWYATAVENCNTSKETRSTDWIESDPYFQNVKRAYDKLEAIAKKYKPMV
ncbi:hypothetical protein G4Y79_17900 [Phototrophicus methaneseepsis]|uniref:Uncharacterized protein n=1 Tax=Phototrophicus methaneseepsis TaxID=2710758 RepID=A0A7S8E756_9CHLR|nr:hypothetical protein [Phototrophicus methaneseepsis]QPC81548.1 hypothetical protein G4Y79_17900 [Phototrophicus methaneseepsis]